MPISIYPPTLKSTQSAFLAGISLYPINFSLQSISSFQDIGHIQIRVVRQSNNKSIVKTSIYPDGIIYKNASAIRQEGSQYYIDISSNELEEMWQVGSIYKIQLRFGTTSIFTSLSEFAEWKQQQIERETFSEWSNVMIIKAISDPVVEILNAQSAKLDVIYSEYRETTVTPLFKGQATISDASKEVINQYKFDLYDADTLNLIESSGWIQYNRSDGGVEKHRFKTVLEEEKTYQVIFTIQTLNNYIKASAPYEFSVIIAYLPEILDITLDIDSKSNYCRENGCINISLSSVGNLTGCYVLIRSSEKSNYQVWEDLHFMTFKNTKLENALVYQDFTIESGIKYRYGLQLENAVGLRTSPVYPDKSNHIVNFEYSFLYRDGVSLRLQFDQQVSSFKHTTLRSKQNTLGGKYPYITQNGNAYYAEFPVSGLITYHMDENSTFLSLRNDGCYYNEELAIPRDKFDEEPTEEDIKVKSLVINHDLTDDNIFIERIFREKVEEFLNDFNCKLYKSPTEGNIIVTLTDVSLTPNIQLGRMIYNFSANACEVAENTFENLNNFGIMKIGSYEAPSADDTTMLSFGQLTGVYHEKGKGEPLSLYELIREKEEVPLEEGYKLKIKRITQFWVDYYSDTNLKAEITKLVAQSTQAETEEERKMYSDQITRYEELQRVLNNKMPDSTIVLQVGTENIVVKPGKRYTIANNTNIFNIVGSAPIVINYICELKVDIDEDTKITSAIDASNIWGQISGIFTGTHEVLQHYDYNYKDSETFRIYNPYANEETVIRDRLGRIIVDNTNYNVYKDTNIYDIILEETRRQVESTYGVSFIKNEEGTYVTPDDSFEYIFGRLMAFDIEADEGTALYIGKNSDGSDAIRVQIGPAGRYKINLEDNDTIIQYISLAEPRYCVINYQCRTNQMQKVSIGRTANV